MGGQGTTALTRHPPGHYLWAPPTPSCAISFEFLLVAPVLLFSMVAHEFAHAEAAYRQGDNTAYMLGRLTLNPLKHIDPFMTVLVPAMLWWASNGAFTFGAAKPVPVNPRNYRRYVRGDIIVSLAGIATNLALFVSCVVLFAAAGLIGRLVPALTDELALFQRMLSWGMWINLLLGFFNLLPIPPLDGSHVFKHLLPLQAGLRYRQLYRLGFIPVLLLVYLVPSARSVYLWPTVKLMMAARSLLGGLAVSPGAFPL